MNPVEWELCLGIVMNCACGVTYRPAYAKAAEYTGFVRFSADAKKRYRLRLIDVDRGDYRRDDAGRIEHITLDLAAVKGVRLLENVTASLNADPHPAVLSVLEKHASAVAMRFEKTRLERSRYPYDVHMLPRFEGSAALKDPNTRLHENVATLLHRGRRLPLFSRRIVYDIDRKTFSAVGLIRHEDPLLHHILPFAVNTPEAVDLLLEMFEIDKEPKPFMIVNRPRKRDPQRIERFFKPPFNRPFRAYFNHMSKKNLGRKDYFIPYGRQHARIWENAVVASALKHPVTLVDVPSERLPDLLFQCVKAALLNGQSVLLVDADGHLENMPPGALDLRSSDAVLLETSLSSTAAEDTKPLPENSGIADAVAASLETSAGLETLMRIQNALSGHYEARRMFHESIHVRSRKVSFETSDVVSLKDVYAHLHDDEGLEARLRALHHERLKKLNLPAYRSLRDRLVGNTDKAPLPLAATLEEMHMFRRLKQLFPVWVVKTTRRLPYAFNAFDMVVLVDPGADGVLDIRYADKLTVIEDSDRQRPTVSDTGTSLSDTLRERKAHGVRCFSFAEADTFDGIAVRHVEPHGPHRRHASEAEAKAIADFLEAADTDYDVRTPFNAQKKLLKKTLSRHARTLHTPLTNRPALVSWAIDADTAAATVDWLKNNPDIVKNLSGQRPLETVVFADMNTVQRHAGKNAVLFDALGTSYRKRRETPMKFTMWRTWLRVILEKASRGSAVFGVAPTHPEETLKPRNGACTVLSSEGTPVLVFLKADTFLPVHGHVRQGLHICNSSCPIVLIRSDESSLLRRLLDLIPDMRVSMAKTGGSSDA